MNRTTTRLAAIILASAVAATAQAHNSLRLFLAERGLSNPAILNSPSLAPELVNPVIEMNGGATKRLYVWAQLHNEDPITVWHGVGFNVRSTGQARITNAVMYNADSTVLSGAAQRWEGVMSPMRDTSGNQTRWSGANGIAALLGAGLQSGNTDTDAHYQHSVQSYLIGHIDVVGVGAIYLEVGDQGIVEFNSPPFPGDEIELGFGDDDDHIRGGHFGAASSLPEAHLVCVGDLNGDGTVNSSDLAILIGVFNTNDPTSDINGDGIVNSSDLALLIGQFNTSCV